MQVLKLSNPVSGHDRHGFVSAPDMPKAVMLVAHGFGEHCGRYDQMAEFLAGQNIAVIAIDLEGHGKSGLKTGVVKDYEILKADIDLMLAEATKRFAGLPIFLFGHSMGGGIALNYGLSRDVSAFSGFIVSAPLIHPAEPITGAMRMAVKLLRRVLPSMTIKNEIPGDKISSVPEEQSKYETDPLNHDRLGLGLAIGMIEGGEWVADQAANWKAPLLMMHAVSDQLTAFDSSQAFADQASHCQFMALENCQHEIHNDVTRDQVYAAITDFIESSL